MKLASRVFSQPRRDSVRLKFGKIGPSLVLNSHLISLTVSSLQFRVTSCSWLGDGASASSRFTLDVATAMMKREQESGQVASYSFNSSLFVLLGINQLRRSFP